MKLIGLILGSALLSLTAAKEFESARVEEGNGSSVASIRRLDEKLPGLRSLQNDYDPDDYDDDDDDDEYDDGVDGFETCEENCMNGGSCELLQLKSEAHKHTMLQRCLCPEGYGGVLCEKKVDICFTAFGKERYCQNEAPCRIDNGEAYCNCAEAYYITAYAGVDCSYPASEYCTDSGHVSHKAFCSNGGSCKTYVANDEDHPGCDCKNGFSGDHCEFTKGESELRTTSSSSSSGGHKLFLAFMVTVYVASLVVLLILVRRWRERTLAERAIVEKANFVTSELTMRCISGPPSSSFGHPSFNDNDTMHLSAGQESKDLNENMAVLM